MKPTTQASDGESTWTTDNTRKAWHITIGGRLSTIVMTCAACYTLMLVLMLTGNQIVCAGLCLVLAIFGWRALDMIRPNVFLIMPVVGWLIYFALKFVLSYLVGIVVGPYQIGKAIGERLSSEQQQS